MYGIPEKVMNGAFKKLYKGFHNTAFLKNLLPQKIKFLIVFFLSFKKINNEHLVMMNGGFF